MRKVEDRRLTGKTGIHRVKISDGNGGRLDLITVTANRVKVIAGAVTAVLMLAGVVFGAVRFGVQTEVHKAIEEESRSEHGDIRRAVEAAAQITTQSVTQSLRDDLCTMEDELQEQHDLTIKLEDGQQELAKQVDRNHDEIMRLLRQGP